MEQLDQTVVHGLGFHAPNELWQAVHILLDASIEIEVSYALSKESRGEDRAYHAGRAEALRSFKMVLLQTRDIVLMDIGRPPESSKS